MEVKNLRIITNSKKMDSCTELFNTKKMLPFYSQYILSILLYVVNNQHLFTKNLEDHNHNKRTANNFYLPIINLPKYHTGAHYSFIS
jgi:hypothetical protein